MSRTHWHNGPVHFVGVDLAWGPRNRTGLAALDERGTVLDLGCAVSDEAVLEWVRAAAPGPCVVGFDAPLLVTNPTGSRPCEAALNRVFRRYDAGAHPANLGKPEFAGGPRALRLAGALGLDVDPWSVAPRRALEVYPHPATIALFGLGRTLKYKHKQGRDLASLRAELLRLVSLIEGLEAGPIPFAVAAHPGWVGIRERVHDATRKSDLKRVEDIVDAVLCGYVALHACRRPAWTHVFTDPGADPRTGWRTGYIVTPVDAALRVEIGRPVSHGRVTGTTV